MSIKIFIIVILITVVQGCAAPYSKFYIDKTTGRDITKWPVVKIIPGEPKVFRGNNQESDYQKMLEDGYFMVGYSAFNSGSIDESGAISQAKDTHASAVILYSKYTNTVSGVVPLTVPNTTTSTTTLSGSVYGSGGYANYSGTENTTNYGTKTTYIPYSVNRSDYMATYWVKLKSATFGAHLRTPTNEERLKMGTNKGMVINAVVNGSPAFKVDIFKGDVLQSLGGIDIYSKSDFGKALKKYTNKKTNVVIIRNGKTINKEITLSSTH